MSPDGEILWEKLLGDGLNDELHSVTQARDGDYLVAGTQDDSSGNNDDFWLAKIAPDGSVRWSQTYDNKEMDDCRSVIETAAGDYVLAGTTTNPGSDLKDAWVVKLDVNEPPTAAFETTGRPMAGQPVSFSAGPSADPDGSIGAYAWDFDADGNPDARGNQVSFTFDGPGEYPVRLTVTDDDGVSTTTEQTIAVAATPTPTTSPPSTATSPPTSTPTARPTAEPGQSVGSSVALVGAGAAALLGAVAWWRRGGD